MEVHQHYKTSEDDATEGFSRSGGMGILQIGLQMKDFFN
jgi:hypothetical protein